MKFCSKCKEWKDTTEYYKNSRGGCKKCVQASHKAWRLKKYPPKPKLKLPNGLRRCSICKEIKADSGFYKDTSSKTGYQHKCKACSNAARKLRNQKYLKPKEVLPDGYKRCAKCKELKSFAEFNKVHGKPKSRCRICESNYRIRNPETSKAYEAKPEVREKRNSIKITKRHTDLEYRAKEKIYRQTYNKRPEVIAKNRKRNLEYRNRPENQAKARAKTIEWRKKNVELAKYQGQVKRLRKFNAEGSHTFEQWVMLLSFFDCCPKCHKQNLLTCDHIIPLSKGGTNYIDNLQPLCRSCNSGKNNYLIVDYRPKEARYWAWVEMSFVAIY